MIRSPVHRHGETVIFFNDDRARRTLFHGNEKCAEYEIVHGSKELRDEKAVKVAIDMLTPYGFKEYNFGDEIKVGDRLYYNNRGKNLFVFSIGGIANETLAIVSSVIGIIRFRKDKNAEEPILADITEEPSAEV